MLRLNCDRPFLSFAHQALALLSVSLPVVVACEGFLSSGHEQSFEGDVSHVGEALVIPGAGYAERADVGDVAAELPGLSGLVASRAYPGVLWAHNDHDFGVLYAIREDGTVINKFAYDIRYASGDSLNIEDIAVVEESSGWQLLVANVGDNAAREVAATGESDYSPRDFITINKLREPDPYAAQVPKSRLASEKYKFTYPADRHDCEAVFADPSTGDIYLIAKETSPADVFLARAPFNSKATQALEHVGTYPMSMACAADISSDGRRIVVRTYGSVKVHVRQPGQSIIAALQSSVVKVPWPKTNMTEYDEAVTFKVGEYGLISSGEQHKDKTITANVSYSMGVTK